MFTELKLSLAWLTARLICCTTDARPHHQHVAEPSRNATWLRRLLAEAIVGLPASKCIPIGCAMGLISLSAVRLHSSALPVSADDAVRVDDGVPAS